MDEEGTFSFASINLHAVCMYALAILGDIKRQVPTGMCIYVTVYTTNLFDWKIGRVSPLNC